MKLQSEIRVVAADLKASLCERTYGYVFCACADPVVLCVLREAGKMVAQFVAYKARIKKKIGISWY